MGHNIRKSCSNQPYKLSQRNQQKQQQQEQHHKRKRKCSSKHEFKATTISFLCIFYYVNFSNWTTNTVGLTLTTNNMVGSPTMTKLDSFFYARPISNNGSHNALPRYSSNFSTSLSLSRKFEKFNPNKLNRFHRSVDKCNSSLECRNKASWTKFSRRALNIMNISVKGKTDLNNFAVYNVQRKYRQCNFPCIYKQMGANREFTYRIQNKRSVRTEYPTNTAAIKQNDHPVFERLGNNDIDHSIAETPLNYRMVNNTGTHINTLLSTIESSMKIDTPVGGESLQNYYNQLEYQPPTTTAKAMNKQQTIAPILILKNMSIISDDTTDRPILLNSLNRFNENNVFEMATKLKYNKLAVSTSSGSSSVSSSRINNTSNSVSSSSSSTSFTLPASVSAQQQTDNSTTGVNGNGKLSLLGLFELSTRDGIRPEGRSELAAAQLAVRHINEQQLLPGYTLELLTNDTKCDPGVGVDRFFHALYTQHSTRMIMLLGSACSEVTESLAKVVPYWNIVQVSFGSTSPALSDRREFPLFYRTVAPDSSHNMARIAFIKRFGWDTVTTFSQNEEIHSLAVNDLVTELESANISCAATITFAETDFRDQLRMLRDLDTRIIIGSFSHDLAPKIFCEVFY